MFSVLRNAVEDFSLYLTFHQPWAQLSPLRRVLSVCSVVIILEAGNGHALLGD